MKGKITIEGKNPIDLKDKTKSLEAIAKLPAKALKNIASLASNKRALEHLTDNIKFNFLKKLL